MPFLMIGTAPWLGIMCPPSAAAIPWMIGLPARSASSPLGLAKPAEATALPCEPYTLPQIAPSIRLNATSRPPASQTATLMRMFISLALSTAPCTIRLASARVRAMRCLLCWV
jgi:hypothetical protein